MFRFCSSAHSVATCRDIRKSGDRNKKQNYKPTSKYYNILYNKIIIEDAATTVKKILYIKIFITYVF